MDELLENTKKAVEKYNSKQAGDRVKATKAVLGAVLACRKYIDENEPEDRGIAQRFARDLSETLATMPLFRNFASDKKTIHNIQNKVQGDEHLASIQKALEESLKNLEMTRKRKIHEWVKAHPVLGKLRRSASKKLPQGAYVLLFRSSHAAGRHKKGRKSGEQRATNLAGTEQAAGLNATEVSSELAVVDASLTTSIQDYEPQTATPGGSVQSPAETAEQTNLAPDTVAIQSSNPEFITSQVVDTVAVSDEGSGQAQTGTEVESNAANLEQFAEDSKTIAEDHSTGDTESSGYSLEIAAESAETENPARNAAQEPVLVVRPAPEGKVFTRFRPREFSDDLRMYRMFRGGPPLVGACIIAEGKLVSAIGDLPQPAGGGDQLRHLVSLSKEAVGKPGREFIESNTVLNELFHLFKSRAVHRDAYVLLFQNSDEYEQHLHSDDHDDEHYEHETDSAEHDFESAEQGLASDEAQLEDAANETAESNDDAHPETEEGEFNDDEQQSSNDEHQKLDERDEVPAAAATLAAQDDEAPASEHEHQDADQHDKPDIQQPQMAHESNREASSRANTEHESPTEGDPANYELVSKRTEDGRIITRFRNFDFNDSRSLYEGFKKRRPVVGAAIIKERELIRIIGSIPRTDEKKQLDLLLRISNKALEKPALEFLEQHEILNELFKLANGDMRDRECSAILFIDDEGRLSVMGFADRRGKNVSKLPLADLRVPRMVFDRFKAERPVVGASVISYPAQSALPPREHARAGGKDSRGDRDRDRGQKGGSDFRSRQSSHKPPVVVAAFGRTPLKQNVLLSAEILKRLGVDPSII